MSTFLIPLAQEFTSLQAHPREYFDSGDHRVIVVGEYAATAHDGRRAESRFVHVWAIDPDEAKISHLHQVADSQVLQTLLTSRPARPFIH